MDLLQFSTLAFFSLRPTWQYNIGFLINNEKLRDTIQETIEDINEETEGYKINHTCHLLSSDPLKAATDICKQLIQKGVYAIVSANADNSSDPLQMVSHIGAFYKIPIIAIEARHSELSDKKAYPTILRTVPPFFDEARGIANLIQSFKWNKVNLVAGNDYDGRITYMKFTVWAYRYNIVIENPIMFPSGKDNVTEHLQPLTKAESKVIVLACSEKDTIRVFEGARTLGILEYIWISNQNAISESTYAHAPQGLLALKLKTRSKKKHLKDAITVLGKTFEELHHQNLDPPPSSCEEESGKWSSGDVLYRSLLKKSFKGDTGVVEFDWYGDRKHSSYSVYNVRLEKLKHVGTIWNGTLAEINKTDIIWPGNQTSFPENVPVSNHLKVVTVQSIPFVNVTELHPSETCADKNYVDPENIKREFKYLPCSKGGRKYCCTGFCMDLLSELAAKAKFTYEINLSEDGKFGSLTTVNGSFVKKWNGAIGEIVERRSDLIVASLTINNERAQYIEFSKPFKYQGITILVKTNNVEKSLFSFLQPFKLGLWLLVLLSVHLIAIILYVLDRFSPFGRFKGTQSNKKETALDLSSAMWFSWGVLLNSGIGEGTPRSFSARVLGMVWAAFAMIIIASYTANLAAFLVLDRPKAVVTGVDDLALQNPSEDFKYGTVKKSSVNTYFRKKVELSNMYTFMQKYNVDNESEGIAKVNSGELKAFIWDSPVLFHETSSNCDVTTAGDLFGGSGYGIGMPKGSPWSNNISQAILQLHQSGIMEEFESKWIKFGNCPVNTHSTTLGLNHMLGVFIMVAGGIGAGIFVVILELLYYKQKGWRKQQRKVLEKTAQHWQEKVKQRKINMTQLTHEQHSMRLQSSNGSVGLFEKGLKVNGTNNHSNRSHSNVSSISASTNNQLGTSESTGDVTNTNCDETQ